MKLMSTYQLVTLPHARLAPVPTPVSDRRNVGSSARRFVERGTPGRFDGITEPFIRVLPTRDHRYLAE